MQENKSLFEVEQQAVTSPLNRHEKVNAFQENTQQTSAEDFWKLQLKVKNMPW